MRKRGFVVVAGLLAIALAGSPASAAAAKVNLRIYGNWTAAGEKDTYEVFQSYLRRYEELNPGVTIEDLGREHNTDKLLAMLITDTAPDLIALGTGALYRFYDQGFIAEVPATLEAKFRREMYPVAVQGNTLRGKMVTLPGQNNVTNVYYNRYVMSEAGLSDKPPATWDQLAEMGKKIARHDNDGKLTRPGVVLSGEGWALTNFALSMLWSLGGDVVDSKGNLVLDDAPIRQVFDTFSSWLESFASHSTWVFRQAQAGFRIGYPFDLETMRRDWVGDYEKDLGVTTMPAGPRGAFAVQYGNSYGVVRGPHEQEVWKLLDWLYFSNAGPGGVAPMTHVFLVRGYPPIRKNDLRAIASHTDSQHYMGFVANLDIARSVSPWYEHGITNSNVLGNAVIQAIKKQASPASILADLMLALRTQQEEYRKAWQ